MTLQTRIKFGASVLFVALTASAPAYAYLDPGTVTMAFSAIAAGLAAGLLYLRVGWSKAVGFFTKRKKVD